MKKIVVVAVAVIGMMFFCGVNVHAGLSNGLVAYYPFNGNADDGSGNGNDGTVDGAIFAEDRFGNSSSAYSFDGMVLITAIK